MRATYHPSRFDHRNNIGDVYKLWSSSLCSVLQPPAPSSILGPNIPLSTLFWNSFNLHTSLSVTDQFSQPYKTVGKIMVLYILNFKFFDGRGKKTLVAIIPKI
jgi:hypothetical protein